MRSCIQLVIRKIKLCYVLYALSFGHTLDRQNVGGNNTISPGLTEQFGKVQGGGTFTLNASNSTNKEAPLLMRLCVVKNRHLDFR